MAKNTIENIYFHCPVCIQNLLITLYGKKLYRKRYNRVLGKILKEIDASKKMTQKEINNFKIKKLKKILCYAYNEIEYYQNLFDDINFKPELFKHIDQLNQIPPTEKEYLRKNPKKFVPKDFKQKTYAVQKTSGTTGTPLVIYVDKYTYQLAMALLVDHEKQHGINFGDRRATFAGRMLQKIDNLNPPFWRFNAAENQMLFSSYHLNDDTFSFYLDQINIFSPKEIIGYPSSIYNFATYIKDSGRRITFKPRIVITNSETLFDWQRHTIEEVFNCQVADYYSTSEYVCFAGQCLEHNYHVSCLLGEIEIVDQNNQKISAGIGDILCTTFTNTAMPLIRYRIGDIGEINNSPCLCGTDNNQTIKHIEGRIDDVIIAPDGRKIGRLDHIFKGCKGIKECQVIQNDLFDFNLLVVKGDKFTRKEEETIKNNLRARVGNEISISVNYVSSIPRTNRGKFKGVIRNIQ